MGEARTWPTTHRPSSLTSQPIRRAGSFGLADASGREPLDDLVSSVRPADWNRTMAAYGDTEGLAEALPAAMVQGVLSIPLDEEKSSGARQGLERLDEGARRAR
ncbi:hypothetical protein [Nocardioides sp. InS609-2]|uniref:hypothetical protein n=1 Tax=Nocardioides sp. InS609-2 TaxID=2760705 RepID=UPI0020BD725E|nr:hypothetical protein [Nocardioides sp. InS609-2]